MDKEPHAAAPGLDDMIDAAQCAAWLNISERTLAAKSGKVRPEIPCFRMGPVRRYHPRTIIAVMAGRAGVAPLVINAMLNMNQGAGK